MLPTGKSNGLMGAKGGGPAGFAFFPGSHLGSPVLARGWAGNESAEGEEGHREDQKLRGNTTINTGKTALEGPNGATTERNLLQTSE